MREYSGRPWVSPVGLKRARESYQYWVSAPKASCWLGYGRPLREGCREDAKTFVSRSALGSRVGLAGDPGLCTNFSGGFVAQHFSYSLRASCLALVGGCQGGGT